MVKRLVVVVPVLALLLSGCEKSTGPGTQQQVVPQGTAGVRVLTPTAGR